MLEIQLDTQSVNACFDLIDCLQIEGISLDLALDCFTGTHDCGMISSAEFPADVVVCRIQELPAQIHRDLSGIGDVFGTVGGCDLLFCEIVVITYRLAYRGNAEFVLVFLDLVLKGFDSQLQGNMIPVVIDREIDGIE